MLSSANITLRSTRPFHVVFSRNSFLYFEFFDSVAFFYDCLFVSLFILRAFLLFDRRLYRFGMFVGKIWVIFFTDIFVSRCGISFLVKSVLFIICLLLFVCLFVCLCLGSSKSRTNKLND